jgi:hypothetical protein
MLDNSESEETLSSDNEYVLENDFELNDESEIKRLRKLIVIILSGLRTWTMRIVETLRLAVIRLTTGFPTMTRKPNFGA